MTAGMSASTGPPPDAAARQPESKCSGNLQGQPARGSARGFDLLTYQWGLSGVSGGAAASSSGWTCLKRLACLTCCLLQVVVPVLAPQSSPVREHDGPELNDAAEERKVGCIDGVVPAPHSQRHDGLEAAACWGGTQLVSAQDRFTSNHLQASDHEQVAEDWEQRRGQQAGCPADHSQGDPAQPHCCWCCQQQGQVQQCVQQPVAAPAFQAVGSGPADGGIGSARLPKARGAQGRAKGGLGRTACCS